MFNCTLPVWLQKLSKPFQKLSIAITVQPSKFLKYVVESQRITNQINSQSNVLSKLALRSIQIVSVIFSNNKKPLVLQGNILQCSLFCLSIYHTFGINVSCSPDCYSIFLPILHILQRITKAVIVIQMHIKHSCFLFSTRLLYVSDQLLFR